MKYRELFILGVIGVGVALIVQVVLSVVFYDILRLPAFDFAYSATGSALIFSLIMAALIEESVRLGILGAYMRLREAPEALISYGAAFGAAFGLSEAFLRIPDASGAWAYLGLAGSCLLHTLLSILAIHFVQTYSRLRLLLSLVLLSVIHVNYNLFVIFGVPYIAAHMG